MPEPRVIAVVTTSRADYGHLYWPMRVLAERPGIELRIVAMGSHLSPEFGTTIDEIRKDGFRLDAAIECLLSSDSDVGMAKTIGLATLGLADALGAMRPDLLLLIADRYEMLAPASVALALRIPIAHIEGGEVSMGAVDDAVRNALTKMSHVHFTSTETARQRVIAMGEEPWRVHRAGAPSLDQVRRSRLLTRAELQTELGVDLGQPTAIVAYHPVTIARDTLRETEAFFTALAAGRRQLLFCYPNADAGSRRLIERTRAFLAEYANGEIFCNLSPVTYWGLLAQADALLGNSSSGIMEAATFGLPVVNVGMRQQGRERAQNILDASAQTEDIAQKIEQAFDPGFRRSLAGMQNPYGDGRAAERITEVLATVPLGEALLIKQPVPLSSGWAQV